MPFKYTTTSTRGRTGSSVLESPLTGVAIDLPAPFAKAAADSAPFRLERTVTAVSPRRETVTVALGTVLNARGEVRYEGGKMIIERAGRHRRRRRTGPGASRRVHRREPKTLTSTVCSRHRRGRKAGRGFNVTALSMRAGFVTISRSSQRSGTGVFVGGAAG
jgi:hypothetical protein